MPSRCSGKAPKPKAQQSSLGKASCARNAKSSTPKGTTHCDKNNNNNNLKAPCCDKKRQTPIKPLSCSSDASIPCVKCGGLKKSKQHPASSITQHWIVETLSLMNRLVQSKQRRASSSSTHSCETEPITSVLADTSQPHQQHHQQRSIEYSLAKTCTSSNNCTASTQTTLEQSILTVSDMSEPHILKILAQIQQYAKSLQDNFEALRRKSSNDLGSQAEVLDQSQVEAIEPAGLAAEEAASSEDDGEAEMSAALEQVPHYASTPRRVEIRLTDVNATNLPLIMESEVEDSTEEDGPRRRFTGSPRNLEESLLSLPDERLEDIEVSLVGSDSTRLFSLPDEQMTTGDQEQQPSGSLSDSDADADSTRFADLPDSVRGAGQPSPEDSDDADSSVYMRLPSRAGGKSGPDETVATPASSTVRILDEVAQDMESIQEKMDRLRRELMAESAEERGTR